MRFFLAQRYRLKYHHSCSEWHIWYGRSAPSNHIVVLYVEPSSSCIDFRFPAVLMYAGELDDIQNQTLEFSNDETIRDP